MDMPQAISVLYRKMILNLNMRFEPLNISCSKAMLMFSLYNRVGQTQNELCQRLDLDKSSVAKALARMEDDGLVTKRTSEKDARAFIVILTEKAEQLMPDILCIQEKWMNELTEEMTEIERSAFCGLMQKAVDKATLMCKDD